MMDYAEKMQRWHEYVEALEEERRKIQVFQRELPLSLELVTLTIEAYRRELSGTTIEHNMPDQSECSEQTSTDHGPILEEFIPIKPTSTNLREENNDKEEKSLSSKLQMNTSGISTSGEENDKRKSDWLRSVQLWNDSSSSYPFPTNTTHNKEVQEVKRSRTGGAFRPFQGEKTKHGNNDNNNNNNNNNDQSRVASKVAPAASVAANSSKEMVGSGRGGGGGGGESKKEEKEGGQRKQRRCWSPKLHRRFLNALHQLGGSHVATPKQIRELMKVDGLTNDEVKSHLQKYRLHTRRPSPTIHTNNNPQPPQFVAMGGIWVQPPVYPSMAAPTISGEPATVAVTNTSHSQVATFATPQLTQAAQKHDRKQNQHLEASEGFGSHSDGGHVNSNSPATSSSTHNTTISPICAC